jgi:hypothetical protein
MELALPPNPAYHIHRSSITIFNKSKDRELIMKQTLVFVAMVALLAGTVRAADTKDEVVNAAKQLGEKDNYSWRSTVVVPEDAPFKPGPTEGKTEKGGFTLLSMSFNDNEMKAVLKGDKGAAMMQGEWQSFSELANSEGPGRFMAMRLRDYKTPAAQAETLATQTKELKKDGDVLSGDLTEEGAKQLLTFRPRGGGEAPTVSDAKGSVKFWVKDGALSKYEFKVKGKMSFNGNDFDQDRTTTVVIKDVGTTKVNVPDEAKKKIS